MDTIVNTIALPRASGRTFTMWNLEAESPQTMIQRCHVRRHHGIQGCDPAATPAITSPSSSSATALTSIPVAWHSKSPPYCFQANSLPLRARINSVLLRYAGPVANLPKKIRHHALGCIRERIQLASSSSETSPAASAKITRIASMGSTSKVKPLRARKTPVATKATRLLPSTNG